MPKSECLVLLAVGTDAVASSRVRGAPVAAYAESMGWRVRRFTGSRRGVIALILVAPLLSPDVLMLQKVPLPRPIMIWVRLWAARVVFDLDDAIYLGYPGDPGGAPGLENRVRSTVRHAHMVTASTPIIADDLAAFGASDVAVFPGPAPVVVSHPQGERDVVLWLGSPSTHPYIADVMTTLGAECPDLNLVAVGAPSNYDSPPCRQYTWTLERQEKALALASVGLMPLPRGRWEDRKAAYKVLEYLAHDIVPVVEIGPPVEALLGARRDSLCVAVEGRDWGRAVRKARKMRVDGAWVKDRDELFEELSKTSFAKLVLKGESE